MIRINENYRKLASSYLFSEIAKRVAAFQAAHPDRSVIRLGIGDVTRPLTPSVVKAFRDAVDEMGRAETFKGYGPDLGYDFLRQAIAEVDFRSRGADIAADEIFVSDGSKCDTGAIQELFAQDLHIAIPDPVYPVYVDTNVMAGRTGPFREGRYGGLIYLDCTEDNGFVPDPPRTRVDLVYLCFPNNPTGATITRAQLEAWVEYARRSRALILYDAAYESFIRDPVAAALDLRGAGRARGGDRVPQLLEDRGLHGHAVRVHRGAEGLHGVGRRGGHARAARPVGAAHGDPVQRRLLPRAAGGGRRLHPGGRSARRAACPTTTSGTRR